MGANPERNQGVAAQHPLPGAGTREVLCYELEGETAPGEARALLVGSRINLRELKSSVELGELHLQGKGVAFVFRHGEHFYNFEGLRQYKEKFSPAWRPRYLVCPQGFGVLPRVLSNVAALVSGGLKGLVTK